nr:hypothetical protein CFP56_10322 [Quercus suber]
MLLTPQQLQEDRPVVRSFIAKQQLLFLVAPSIDTEPKRRGHRNPMVLCDNGWCSTVKSCGTSSYAYVSVSGLALRSRRISRRSCHLRNVGNRSPWRVA